MKSVSTLRRYAVLALASLLVVAHGIAAEADIILPKKIPNEKFNQAIVALGQGDLKQADVLFQQISENDPAAIYAVLGHAQVAITERRVADADRVISSILAERPNMAEAHNMKGVVLLLQQRQTDARMQFLRAIELAPRYVTPRIYIAALARASNNLPDAETQYKALTNVAPQLPTGYIGQAEALMMMRRSQEAFNVLEHWKTVAPASPLPSQIIANLYLADGNAAKARQELKTALIKHPRDSGTLKLLGDAYSAAGDFTAAGAQYDSALAADATNIDALIRTGDLKAQTGQTDAALAIYRKALKMDAANPLACNNVAWLLAEQGRDLDEALRLAHVATKATPDYVDAQDTLGWVYYRRGEYALAVATLKKAVTLDGKRTDVAAHLGLAYAKTGMKSQALAELKRALAASPPLSNHVELEKVVAQLRQ